eukprot:589611-Amphidinium_carterae.1
MLWNCNCNHFRRNWRVGSITSVQSQINMRISQTVLRSLQVIISTISAMFSQTLELMSFIAVSATQKYVAVNQGGQH